MVLYLFLSAYLLLNIFAHNRYNIVARYSWNSIFLIFRIILGLDHIASMRYHRMQTSPYLSRRRLRCSAPSFTRSYRTVTVASSRRKTSVRLTPPSTRLHMFAWNNGNSTPPHNRARSSSLRSRISRRVRIQAVFNNLTRLQNTYQSASDQVRWPVASWTSAYHASSYLIVIPLDHLSWDHNAYRINRDRP